MIGRMVIHDLPPQVCKVPLVVWGARRLPVPAGPSARPTGQNFSRPTGKFHGHQIRISSPPRFSPPAPGTARRRNRDGEDQEFILSLPESAALCQQKKGEAVMPQSGRALSPKAPVSGRLGEAAPPKTEGLREAKPPNLLHPNQPSHQPRWGRNDNSPGSAAWWQSTMTATLSNPPPK